MTQEEIKQLNNDDLLIEFALTLMNYTMDKKSIHDVKTLKNEVGYRMSFYDAVQNLSIPVKSEN